eukprot:805186_1
MAVTRDLLPARGHDVFNDIPAIVDSTLSTICGAFIKRNKIKSCVKKYGKKIINDKVIGEHTGSDRNKCKVFFKHREELTTPGLEDDRNKQDWKRAERAVTADVASFVANILVLHKYKKAGKRLKSKQTEYKRSFKKLKVRFKEMAEDTLKYNGNKQVWIDYPIGKVYAKQDPTQKKRMIKVLKKLKKAIQTFPSLIAKCVEELGGETFVV